jgi:probable rRNA maturation factor
MITLEPLRGMDSKVSPWLRVGLSASGLGRFLRAAQRAVGLEGEVHVLLADDATLRRLNRTFRGKDKATDVLSFPAGPTTVFFGDPEGPGLAGDLAISLETAARQAAQFGHSLRDEVRVLLLHGVLHLAGFDHEQDTGEMAAREAELREKLGLPAGLIARVSGGSKGKGKQRITIGRKAPTVGAGSDSSGSFDSSAHGKAVSASAQDDAKRSRDDGKIRARKRVRG